MKFCLRCLVCRARGVCGVSMAFVESCNSMPGDLSSGVELGWLRLGSTCLCLFKIRHSIAHFIFSLLRLTWTLFNLFVPFSAWRIPCKREMHWARFILLESWTHAPRTLYSCNLVVWRFSLVACFSISSLQSIAYVRGCLTCLASIWPLDMSGYGSKRCFRILWIWALPFCGRQCFLSECPIVYFLYLCCVNLFSQQLDPLPLLYIRAAFFKLIFV